MEEDIEERDEDRYESSELLSLHLGQSGRRRKVSASANERRERRPTGDSPSLMHRPSPWPARPSCADRVGADNEYSNEGEAENLFEG